MSMSLDLGTKPAGLEVKTYTHTLGSLGKSVHLGAYEISLEDFLVAAGYVLTNTDLAPNDPRLQFVKYVQSMRVVEGHNRGGERLEPTVPVLLPEHIAR